MYSCTPKHCWLKRLIRLALVGFAVIPVMLFDGLFWLANIVTQWAKHPSRPLPLQPPTWRKENRMFNFHSKPWPQIDWNTANLVAKSSYFRTGRAKFRPCKNTVKKNYFYFKNINDGWNPRGLVLFCLLFSLNNTVYCIIYVWGYTGIMWITELL